MWYVIMFCIGVLSGVAISATMTASGSSARIEEAYRNGIEEGKKISSNMNKN